MKLNAKFKSLLKISDACPTQWEGQLEDGRNVYIRFRFGRLTVHISPLDSTDVFALDPAFVWYDDDEWNGVMEFAHLSELTGLIAPDGYVEE